MTYVITQGCCSDAACVTVCPVQCIRPRPGDPDFTTTEQLYVDPASCVDCGACTDECPVEAAQPEWELPDRLAIYTAINAEYFERRPIVETDAPDFSRRRLPPGHDELRVAVIGAGPAGCYTAGALSELPGVSVSLIDRLPTPFGLVRAGVAPDHAGTKLMGDRFTTYLNRASVHCYFNVAVGDVAGQVTTDDLLAHHHAIVWATGADGDRELGIPGEHLPGTHSARDFVGWYNGNPDHADDTYDLSIRRAVVIGNGNVALDVARMLLRDPATLRTTDMADHAVDALARSAVEEVLVVGRKGPEHAAFSLGELLGLDSDPDIGITAVGDEVIRTDEHDRRMAILQRVASDAPTGRRVVFRFDLTPEQIEGDDRTRAITFRRTDGTSETVEAGLVLRAIGYRGTEPDAALPFDAGRGTFAHEAGRVSGAAGHYCTGWIKRGARGTIGTNKSDAQETVGQLLTDLEAGRLATPGRSVEDWDRWIRSRVPDLVDKVGWRRIDEEERRSGAGERPRRKLVRREELLAAARTPG